MNIQYKICTKCGEKKSLTEFYSWNNRISCCCKQCFRNKSANYRLKNADKISKDQHEIYLKNKDKRKEYNDKYREINKKRISDQRKKFREENKDKVRNQRKKLRQTNPKVKIIIYLRNRFNEVIKRNTKSGSTIERLGCSIDFLKKHLESKFQEGMTWDNQGINGWHIDHIRPLASFDLSKKSEQFKACHYTNLQPLWEEDNLAKSDKYNPI